ncbi:helix-turn-helix domain-containing protein [Cupriavidus metallidurans]|uniref:GlxA family transcriptional regulator n=1 Tax=Cupriavidus TaxID=106589 RepID=UPI002579509B|nr:MULTISPECIES: helix-turn-helix domain-containing protein [unclassified Cupriavidus]GMG93954.1 hypothetical protein Cmtc_51740 [Cupriavidus sp. TKC]
MADPATTSNHPLHVKLLWLPDAMPGTLFGALDVLRTAAGVAQLQRPGESNLLTWEIIGGNGRALPAPLPGLQAVPARRGQRHGRTLMIVPGLMAHSAPHLSEMVTNDTVTQRTIARHVDAGGWLAAIYSGMVYPLALGLLDGARCGAPWMFQSSLAQRFPGCDLSSDEPIGLHERVFHCVAPALLTEFMLRVLGHLHDPDLAQTVSRLLLYQQERQQWVPELVSQRWLGKTTDSPVYRAIGWLQAHVDEPYRLGAVAEAAAVSERTLLRHFRQVTGQTPLDYLHRLRVERARMLLEVTLHGTQAIAEACGYSDAAAFRRLFQRAMQMSMSEYRTRFALRTRRRYWRVEGQAARRGRAAPQT